MSFLDILYTLLLEPLQLIFETIYAIANRRLNNPGASITILSLVMNFLVLPLYRRADAMQEEERQMEMKLRKGVAHIKRIFRGDEQMMMLRTYYRQNNYKPTYVLRGAASLFLEIPFFIAAYHFLSELQLLNGVSFGPIADLGSPDGILKIHGVSINILPFIMTAVNLCSCIIFTKDSSFKTKLQLYGMAIFFLVFLYASPAGLVFYWTLNNLFSLAKTIFYKLKSPGRILDIISLKTKSTTRTANKTVFLSGSLFLSILTGVLIPSAVIKSSPQEFIASSTIFYHPAWFIVSSFCLAFGLFTIWMGVFYWLASPSAKSLFDKAIWIILGIMVINYMFFNKSFGNLSASLRYEYKLEYTIPQQLWNLILILAAVFALHLIYVYIRKSVSEILIIGIVAIAVMSATNISYINSSVTPVKNQMENNTEIPTFTLSRTGKNVIVLMLDRALGEQIPYIFDEKPELKKQFDGFTYYANTVSFGGSTNFGSPALMGGYEYTPVEMNTRADEPLVSKHNESLKVMPVLFDQNGYNVTVINPVYANYQWTPDLTIYEEYPNIKAYNTGDKFIGNQSADLFIANNKRNFFCYSLFKTMPLCVHQTIYNNGNYNQVNIEDGIMYSEQNLIDAVTATGMSASFMESYSVLENLPDICATTDEDIKTFLLMVNDTPHEPMLLQEPDYIPSPTVNNTKYEDDPPKRILNGRTLKLENSYSMILYHANMASMIQLGKWFDYMRKESIYDNTRIILVSDHGHFTGSIDELILDDGTCVSGFYPLLMVKDFNNSGFTTSDVFMTHADVPTLATDEIISFPINPFTGKVINSDEKTAHKQYIINSLQNGTDINNGNTFLPANWYSVHDNIWNQNNWELIATDAVLSAEDY